MKVYYSDHFTLPLPEGHRFPIEKYALLRKRVMADGIITNGNAIVPPQATLDQLRLAHNPEYVQRVINGELSEKEVRRIGFPWSLGLVQRSRRSVGGTIAACRTALQEGVSANLAGGTHHAFPDHGEGYCVFNDCAVAARAMQAENRVRRVVILDCDVHQGNGTAAIFAQDPSVFTFSIHGAKNFPFHKEPSDLDIALPDGCGDDQYLDSLRQGLEQSLSRAGAGLAIYLAGADPYEGDRLGRLALSKPGLVKRDSLVFSLCGEAGIPVAVTMSGGYADCVDDSVDIHYQTIKIAAQYH
jgi:acetoin utilization deacetylase AcuC-like enzyme